MTQSKIKSFVGKYLRRSNKPVAILLVASILFASFSLANINVIKIYDFEQVTTLITSATIDESTLKNQILDMYEGQMVDVEFEKTDDGYTAANIIRPVAVNITEDGYTVTELLMEGTVADLLEASGITLGEYDYIDVSINADVSTVSSLTITRVEYETNEVYEDIPYTSSTVGTTSLAYGVSSVSTTGSTGLKKFTYVSEIVDGEKVSTTLVSEEIVLPAVNEVIQVGLKVSNTVSNFETPSYIELDANGQPTNYSSVIYGADAAAYTASAGKNTATGVTAQPGYVAVDPSIIPYGTELYVVSADGSFVYGYAIAADTGGSLLNGTLDIDLFFNTVTECYSFGRQDVNIYIL